MVTLRQACFSEDAYLGVQASMWCRSGSLSRRSKNRFMDTLTPSLVSGIGSGTLSSTIPSPAKNRNSSYFFLIAVSANRALLY